MTSSTPCATLNVTRSLAQAVVRTDLSTLPPATLEIVRACLLDSLGVTLAGAHEPVVNILCDTLSEYAGAGTAVLIGRGGRTSLPDAALINGTAGHALDFDDMHIASATHPSVPVVAAAISLADHLQASGAELLRALALGIEVEVRIGSTVHPNHYQQGWHATGTIGHFGAAVAAACLLKLDEQRLNMALSIAATQASGLKENFGTMSKPLHAGQAARNGLMAALLAQRGFTGAADILGGHYGFGRVLSRDVDWSPLLADWGQHWLLHDILFKPHASSFCTQALIECALELRQEPGLSPDGIGTIQAEVSLASHANARIDEPRDGMEAKFSLAHAIVQGLIHGQATIADFTDERAQCPRFQALRSVVTIVPNADLAWPEAIVTVNMRDGTQLRRHVDMRASTANSADRWQSIVGKYQRVTEGLLPALQRDAIVQGVAGLGCASTPIAGLISALMTAAASDT